MVGQEQLKKVLDAEFMKFPRHSLFVGQPGLGKSHFAKHYIQYYGYESKTIYGTPDMTHKDLTNWLVSMDRRNYGYGGQYQAGAKRYIMVIDEIHALKSSALEALYLPLQACEVTINGIVSWLPDFALIGITTNPYLLPQPFIDRIPLQFEFMPYTHDELCQIVAESVKLPREHIEEVVKRSRGTARLALNYALAVRDMGLEYFDAMGIDAEGLNSLDRRYLHALQSSDRPLSVNTLAAMCGVSSQTLLTMVEPYMLRLGKIFVTSRGRTLSLQNSLENCSKINYNKT